MEPVTSNTTDFERTQLSGQGVLPGLQQIMECEAAALEKPEHERFCVKYVLEAVGDAARAWQLAIDPDCSRRQAQKNASKLLKNGDIRRRIAEISAVMRNRSINEVLAFNLRALNFTPGDLFDDDGRMIPLKDLPPGTGVEARIVDGCLRYIPVFPSPEKARDSIAKIMGIEKQLLEVAGKDGGPIVTKIERVIVYPDECA
jgi:hypothetical protein